VVRAIPEAIGLALADGLEPARLGAGLPVTSCRPSIPTATPLPSGKKPRPETRLFRTPRSMLRLVST